MKRLLLLPLIIGCIFLVYMYRPQTEQTPKKVVKSQEDIQNSMIYNRCDIKAINLRKELEKNFLERKNKVSLQ